MLLTGWAPIPLLCAFAVLTGMAGAVVWPVLSGMSFAERRAPTTGL